MLHFVRLSVGLSVSLSIRQVNGEILKIFKNFKVGFFNAIDVLILVSFHFEEYWLMLATPPNLGIFKLDYPRIFPENWECSSITSAH